MSKDKGYIALWRDITEHFLWKDKPFSKAQAWIDLILLANHTTQKVIEGETIQLYERGCIYRSQLQLSKRWGWDRRKVKRFLQTLENENMIKYECGTRLTRIWLVNYEKYQKNGTTDCSTDGTTQTIIDSGVVGDDGTTDCSTDGTTSAQRHVQRMHNDMYTNNNYNNYNNYIELNNNHNEALECNTNVPPLQQECSKVVGGGGYGTYHNINLSDAEYKNLCEVYSKQITDSIIDKMSVWIQEHNKPNYATTTTIKEWINKNYTTKQIKDAIINSDIYDLREIEMQALKK